MVRRHNRIRDWLAALIADWTGRPTNTEQIVPRWDRWVRDRRERGGWRKETARLDIVFTNKHGQRVFVDVSVTDAASEDRERAQRRARADGVAAAAQEDVKRLRYPGADMVPFVLEALGRPRDSAIDLLRGLAPSDPIERSKVLGEAWQTLSAIVQEELAESLLTAAVEGFCSKGGHGRAAQGA